MNNFIRRLNPYFKVLRVSTVLRVSKVVSFIFNLCFILKTRNNRVFRVRMNYLAQLLNSYRVFQGIESIKVCIV